MYDELDSREDIALLLEGASSEVCIGMTPDAECEEKPRGCHLFKGIELRQVAESQLMRVSKERQRIQHSSPLLNPYSY